MQPLNYSKSGDATMATIWKLSHDADAVRVRNFTKVENGMNYLLYYFPAFAAAVHGLVLIFLIAEHVRHQTANGPLLRRNVGAGRRGVKRFCILAFFLCSVPLPFLPFDFIFEGIQWSINEVGLYTCNPLGWLTICFLFKIEETKERSVFRNIVEAWWVVLLVLSALVFGVAVFAGSVFSGSIIFESLMSSLFVVIVFFTVCRRGQTAELSSIEKPLLSDESLSSKAGIQRPISSGFSNAGLLSVLAFTWLNPLLAAGNQKPLIIEDIPLLDPVDDANSNFDAFDECWQRDILNSPTGAPSSILWTLLRAFWKPFTYCILLTVVYTIAMFVGPILQNLLINFMEEEHRNFIRGGILVTILLVGKLIEAVTAHQSSFRSRKLGLRMWAGVSRAVYNKSLRLSLQARQMRSIGEITNILSTDVQRLLQLMYYVQQGVAFPLQLVIALVVLFEVVGVAMVTGLVTLVIMVMVNLYNVRIMRNFKRCVLIAKDKRMRATTELLGNLKVIKLQAWDEMFQTRIEGLREIERVSVEKFMHSWATIIFLTWTGPIAVSALTFLTMFLLGDELSTARVFTALTTFRIIQEPIRFIPDVTANIIQASVSLKRVRAFLMEDEVDEKAVDRVSDSSHAVDISHASFSWDKQGTAPAISNLNLRIKKGTCVAICGSVGSGKSSLLYSIMGELPKLSGTVKLCGRVAYVAQSAWIQNLSIRENILFGSPMDPKRYNEAVRVSGLETDLAQFPYRDETEIGERGTNLSGGQKQRVQLARAVYQDADIYVLDDPFSAVDAHTGTFLFEVCVRGALRHKTVILVTHQLEFLPAADMIIVMKSPGEIVQQGSYDELVQEGKDFGAFVEALKESLDSVNRASHVKSDEEPELLLDSDVDLDENMDVSVELTRTMSMRKSGSNRVSESVDLTEAEVEKFIQDEIRATGSIDRHVVWAYLTKVRGGSLCLYVFIFQLTTIVCQIASDGWLAHETSNDGLTSSRFIEIYILLVVGCSLSVYARTHMVAYAGVSTAQAYFTSMLKSIIRAPMSFIDSTPLGRILTRCSTDQTAVDMELPNSCAGVGNSATALVGTILITTYATWEIIFLLIPLALMYLRLRTYYIKSSRELSRLTAITEAPVFLLVSESIGGTTTIRAFREQRRFEDTNAQRLECYQRAAFHNLASAEWLGLRLDSVAAVVLSAAAILLITLPEGTIAPGLAGMDLSYGLTLGAILMRLVNSSCNFENRMVSVERIAQYSEIASEAALVIQDRRPPSEWPNAGRIEMQNVQIRYRAGAPFVLKGISCVIHPREKVGIVGRTGSGKSTFVQALFRMMEPADGCIIIDNIDITKIGLNDLRSALGVIPQEPTLFEGSVRSNLDPFELYSDGQLWEVLDKCQLSEVVRDKPNKLQASVAEQGENWSVGQRQLLCLGRALLRQARVLVLDEATASVDITTDAVIQSNIRQYFANSTVISVAHRIPTVIDSDRVLVLDAGFLMENNAPENLLANDNSMFSKLVQEYTQRTESKESPDTN